MNLTSNQMNLFSEYKFKFNSNIITTSPQKTPTRHVISRFEEIRFLGGTVLPQDHTGRGATIPATDHIGHSKTISATTENHIGHTENPYRPQIISATKHMMSLSRLLVYRLLSCHTHTSLFRVVFIFLPCVSSDMTCYFIPFPCMPIGDA